VDKSYKLADEKGMYLLVTPAGGKLWRLDYRHGGKRKTMALGAYPDVTLADARGKRDEARKQLAAGIDPMAERAALKASRVADGETFEVIAREWFAKYQPAWAENHSKKIIQRFEKDLFPWLGARPIRDITAPELLTVLRRIEARGAVDTAHRAHQNCSQVFRYAVATGRCERDPSGDLRGALPPVKGNHFAALLEPRAIGALLRDIDAYQGGFVVKSAMQLAPLVFVRPGELRQAEWKDIDMDRAEWAYLVTKTKTEHIVPLSAQAVAVLRELHPLTGHGRFVFPSARTPSGDRCLSENAVLAALRRMGYAKDEMCGHGFRAMARTILHETLGFAPEPIEHQLAHRVPDALGRSYNRTKFLDERKRMMQRWADYLDGLKHGADVIPFRNPA
jgi:integrase